VLLENAVTQDSESDKAQAYLDQAFTECQQLRRLVDDLMLLARLDSRDIDGSPIDIDLSEMVEDLAELWLEIGQERDVTLNLDVAPGIHITGYPVLLRRLLANLTENAFKHTPAQGTIAVSARCQTDQLFLDITDSGHGIASSELPKLFNRFYRTSTAQTERISGTGLGLNICQKIVLLHGGTIDVESQAGKGTRLRVTLPLQWQHDKNTFHSQKGSS
jgi:signal transduction histidine kinase